MGVTRTIKTSTDNGTVVITGTGDLDLHVGKEFDKVLADAVASVGPVIVDFTNAVFVDSAILQSVAKYAKVVYNRGDRMKVLVTSGSHPAYVLRAVGFEALADIVGVKSENGS